jgi:hypothetical protein
MWNSVGKFCKKSTTDRHRSVRGPVLCSLPEQVIDAAIELLIQRVLNSIIARRGGSGRRLQLDGAALQTQSGDKPLTMSALDRSETAVGKVCRRKVSLPSVQPTSSFAQVE